MTHDELLEKLIDEMGFITPHNALRAVVELHKPIVFGQMTVVNRAVTTTSLLGCKHCEIDYPCPTIQAIMNELM